MEERNKRRGCLGRGVGAGISFGSALAMIISYTNWHSILWAIFHGFLSWIYVIYFAVFH